MPSIIVTMPSVPGSLSGTLLRAVLLATTLFRGAVSQDAAEILYGSEELISLNATSDHHAVTVVDYGLLVEGFPTFEVIAASGDTSKLEVTYSEYEGALDSYHADGPLPLASTMSTYRVNQYNITSPGTHTSRLIQGGFRFQKFNLSTTGQLQLRRVGVQPTTSLKDLASIPGSFRCSDEQLNQIWTAGARTALLTQFFSNTIPDFWQMTEDGVLIESAAPQSCKYGVQLVDYVFEFDTRPVRGGFAFLVRGDTLNEGVYVLCDLAARSITVHLGSTEVDTVIASGELPPLAFAEWHSVQAVVAADTVQLTIDGENVFNFTHTSNAYGSFGMGAALGHSAYYRNLTVSSAETGTVIYSSPLTDKSFYGDFYTGTNPHDTLIDGSKRDRIAYIGDIDHGLANAFALNWGASFVNGSINLVGSFQSKLGFWVPSAKISQEPAQDLLDTNITGLIGHSFNFMSTLGRYYQFQGDLSFAQFWAPRIIRMLDWAASQSLDDGLFSVAQAEPLGLDWNWYDPGQNGTVSKFNAAYAYSLQETMPLLRDAGIDTAPLEDRLAALRAAMNAHLYSDELGAYAMSDTLSVGFAQDANGIAILAGVPQAANRSAQALLNVMQSELFRSPSGPLPFSPGVIEAGWLARPSPFASGWHLRAAFAARDGDAASALLRGLWWPLADPSYENHTGTYWEVLDENGAPGLGTWTSAAHGFSAAPASELIHHVAGIQPKTPGFVEWEVEPPSYEGRRCDRRQLEF
ncbi:Six-hairpin glycosidase-like protein [Xylariomycetidae sp. FL2044]|nr:Six-hairpin glycosidase-like protein [Xylariomycetidae sp. FL2044]